MEQHNRDIHDNRGQLGQKESGSGKGRSKAGSAGADKGGIRAMIRTISSLAVIAGLLYVLWYGCMWYLNESIYKDIFERSEASIPESEIDLEAIGWQYWNDQVLREFQQLNPDCVAMICIPGTMLHYPVLQTDREQGSYYLYKDLNGKYNINGSIFMDHRCRLYEEMATLSGGAGMSEGSEISGGPGIPEATENRRPVEHPFNLIIYGHNMRNGSMFGMVRRYTDEEFFNEHPSVYLNYGQEYKKYDICSVITLSADLSADRELFRVYEAPSEEDREAFVKEISARSIYDTGVVPQTDDSYIMLSTCYYGKSNGRVLVVTRQDQEFRLPEGL